MSVQLVFVLIVAFAGYLVSLWLHPYTRCRACGGSSRHVGAVFGYGFRPCRRCKGKGRKVRLGCHLFRPELSAK